MANERKIQQPSQQPVKRPASAPRIRSLDRSRAEVERAIAASKRSALRSWDTVVLDLLGATAPANNEAGSAEETVEA